MVYSIQNTDISLLFPEVLLSRNYVYGFVLPRTTAHVTIMIAILKDYAALRY